MNLNLQLFKAVEHVPNTDRLVLAFCRSGQIFEWRSSCFSAGEWYGIGRSVIVFWADVPEPQEVNAEVEAEPQGIARQATA